MKKVIFTMALAAAATNINAQLVVDSLGRVGIGTDKDASISVGYNVTNSMPYGKVLIERGSKLNISKKKGVLIKNGFKCKLGGELRIK